MSNVSQNFNSGKSKREIQFIVNNGIIYNKKDIMNLLWDLGHVNYFEVDGEKVINKGKGFIMRVSSNNEDPTLFLNGRIYINSNSFDYLKVRKVKESMTLYELFSDGRVIKLVPDMKKQMYPPYKFVAETVMGLGMMEEEMPPENADGPSGEFKEDNPFN